LPQQRIPLKGLWQQIPEEARQQTLLTLSRVVARQLAQPPDRREVRDEPH
jgi:hypothetical protein